MISEKLIERATEASGNGLIYSNILGELRKTTRRSVKTAGF
jgi:hypothetical protein